MIPARVVMGFVIGAIAGYGWYRLVGCRTGACPLTANPWISTLYGAGVGVLAAWGR